MVDPKTPQAGEGESLDDIDKLLNEVFENKEVRTRKRLARERAASRSPAQRERSRSRKTRTINFRTTDAVRNAVEALQRKRGLKSMAPVVEEAILALAKSEGIEP